jgi:vacuolar-type H+-ATPase subunit I/STV1
MAKVELQKIRVTGLKAHYKILMQELHRAGVLEITDNPKFVAESNGAAQDHFGVFDLARLDFVIQFLGSFATPGGKLDAILSGGKLVLSENEAKERLQAFSGKSESLIEQCEKYGEDIVRSRNELAKIPAQKDLLASLGNFETPLQADFNTEKTLTFLGKIASKKELNFLSRLAAFSNLIDVEV